MLILKVAGLYLGLMYATWLLFVAIMGFRAARLAGKLSKPVFVLALPALAVGVLSAGLVYAGGHAAHGRWRATR